MLWMLKSNIGIGTCFCFSTGHDILRCNLDLTERSGWVHSHTAAYDWPDLRLSGLQRSLPVFLAVSCPQKFQTTLTMEMPSGGPRIPVGADGDPGFGWETFNLWYQIIFH